jgi:hypothetical protein
MQILTEQKLSRYQANQGYVYWIHAVGTNRYKIGRRLYYTQELKNLYAKQGGDRP